jgi:hypothetical protein
MASSIAEQVQHLPRGAVLAGLAGGSLIYLVGLAVYRLFLHPLTRFPGPKLAALTRWYEFYYEVVKGGQFTFDIQEMHKKHGK